MMLDGQGDHRGHGHRELGRARGVYTYDKFVGDLAADVPNFVLKRAQITKLRKLFSPNETYMPLGQVGSELPVAAVPPPVEATPVQPTKKAAKKARKAAAAASPAGAVGSVPHSGAGPSAQGARAPPVPIDEPFELTEEDVHGLGHEDVDVPGDEPPSSSLSTSPYFEGCDCVLEMLSIAGIVYTSEAGHMFVFNMVESDMGMSGIMQIETASDVLEQQLLTLDRADPPIQWRASGEGVRRAHTSLRAALAQLHAKTISSSFTPKR